MKNFSRKNNDYIFNYPKEDGFSLIETLIYIGIFTLIMASTLISIYSIIGSNSRNKAKAMVEEEGSFLIGKIDWVLTGIKDSSVSADGNKLTVTKFDPDMSGQIILEITNNNLNIKRGINNSQGLNNSNVSISCPSKCFKHVKSTASGINPESIEAAIRISTKTEDGLPYFQDFYTIKYLRK